MMLEKLAGQYSGRWSICPYNSQHAGVARTVGRMLEKLAGPMEYAEEVDETSGNNLEKNAGLDTTYFK